MGDALGGEDAEGLALDGYVAERFVYGLQHVGGELAAGGCGVPVDLLGARGADDRRRQLVAAQHPGQSHLGQGEAGAVCDRAQAIHRLD